MFPLCYSVVTACMLYYCDMVRWAWLDWGLSRRLTTLLQCSVTVGWVIRPVKISSLKQSIFVVKPRSFSMILCLNFKNWNDLKSLKKPQNYRVSLAIWDHTMLLATRHKRTHPTLTLASEGGTRFTYPGGMEGWVDLGGWLHTEMVYPPTGGHPSKY